MSKENDKKQEDKLSSTRAFTSDLKSRQSVRTTFRLSKGCIDAIGILANQMGKKKITFRPHG